MLTCQPISPPPIQIPYRNPLALTRAATATFVTVLTDPSGMTAVVSFNSTTGTLVVCVWGAAGAETLDVIIGDTPVACILTNSAGRGRLRASRSRLTVQTGTTVQVGSLTGTFLSVADTRLSAQLCGASGATGGAGFNALDHFLKVWVKNAVAHTSYTVTLGTLVLGTFTTDAAGNGRLTLMQSDLAIATGSTITVTDSVGIALVQGSFASAARGRCA